MLLMQVSPRTFGLNMYLIIGAVLLGVLLLIVAIAVWTGVKTGFWHLGRKRAADAERRRRLDPGGWPCPPTARGLCDRCGRSFENVYYLPSGERRCPLCYEATLKEHS